jgi:DNA-binding CsgD family transcriptional regulator
MHIINDPKLSSILLDVCAAVTYEDFANVAVDYCARVLPNSGGEVLLGYLDFDADNDRALVVRSRFPSKLARNVEEKKMRQQLSGFIGKYMETRPDIGVYRGQKGALGSLEQLKKSDWYKRIMVPEGWHDFVGMRFNENAVNHSNFFINRSFDLPPFSDSELALFAEAYPYFASALHRVRLLHDAQARNLDLENSLFDLPVATLLIDWNYSVEQFNRDAARLCCAWERGPSEARLLKLGGCPRLPADLKAICQEMREIWRSADNASIRPLRRTLRHPVFADLEAKITLLRPHAMRLSFPSFLIRITDLSVSEPRHEEEGDVVAISDLSPHAQLLSRLSPAERELIPLLKKGLSNKEMASKLGKSVPTVKKQMHSVLDKLGRPSRTRLVALLK